MNERRQRRHSATTLHVALSTVTESERRMVPHTSLYPAIGRVRATECNRLDIMIGSPHVGGEEVEKQGEEAEGVGRGETAFNCEWKFARREPSIV